MVTIQIKVTVDELLPEQSARLTAMVYLLNASRDWVKPRRTSISSSVRSTGSFSSDSLTISRMARLLKGVLNI